MRDPEKSSHQPTFIEELSQHEYAIIGAVALATILSIGVCTVSTQRAEHSPTSTSTPLNRNTTSTR